MYAKAAKERQHKGRPRQDEKEVVENFPQVNAKSRDEAAKAAGANPHYVTDAKASIGCVYSRIDNMPKCV